MNSTNQNTQPIELSYDLVNAKKPEDVLRILNLFGVAVIAITCDENELKNAIDTTKMYQTANAMFQDQLLKKSLTHLSIRNEKLATMHKGCCTNMELPYIPLFKVMPY
jgi:hypothetical protein